MTIGSPVVITRVNGWLVTYLLMYMCFFLGVTFTTGMYMTDDTDFSDAEDSRLCELHICKTSIYSAGIGNSRLIKLSDKELLERSVDSIPANYL